MTSRTHTSFRHPPALSEAGERVVSVAESVLAPPGPIPNPVVTQSSAGEYCGGDPVGGEAAADTTLLHATQSMPRGGAAAARWAHNPKVAGSNPAPATTRPDPTQGSGLCLSVDSPSSRTTMV